MSGSAEPALVLYALGTEHLPRCSHMDAILRFVRQSSSSVSVNINKKTGAVENIHSFKVL